MGWPLRMFQDAGGEVALRVGPWGERGPGGEECGVAGTHVSGAAAGAGEATVPRVQLDEALEQEGERGHGGGGGAFGRGD